MAGVYTFRYLGRGVSFAGVHFMREQVRTVGVWVGGDDPPPHGGNSRGTGGKSDGCYSDVLKCLLRDRGEQQLLKQLEIDGKRIAKCLQAQR